MFQALTDPVVIQSGRDVILFIAGAVYVAKMFFPKFNGGAKIDAVVTSVEKIKDNTSSLPRLVEHLEDYMATGRVAMKQIDRMAGE